MNNELSAVSNYTVEELLINDAVHNESMCDVRKETGRTLVGPISYVHSEMLEEFSIVRLPY